MQQENFSPQDSLRVIQSMLEKSKQDIRGNDIYFLMWGWITFIACTGQFLLKRVFDYPYHYRVWWLTILGVLLTVYIAMRQKNAKKVRTYIEESMGFLWIGMGISFFVLTALFFKIGWGSPVFPFFIMLYGLGTFVSGCLLRFRPFIVGGISAWVIAIAAAFMEYDYQILMAGLAIMVSYIIPAYMLRSKTGNTNRKVSVGAF